MQPVMPPSLHPKLMNLYKGRVKEEPVKIPYARVSYIDFNQNGKRDAGEELKYNQKTDVLLKRIVLTENDLFQLEKVNTLISSENNHKDDHLNQMEAYLIARRALLASDVDLKNINKYLYKLEGIYQGYLKYQKDKNLSPKNSIQDLDYLHQYLWNNGKNMAEETMHRFDLIMDNQLKYFSGANVKVGNCSGLTTLKTTLSFRRGIPIEVVQVNDEMSFHIFNKFGTQRIENTNYLGINHKQYKTYKVGSVDELILSLLINTAYEYDKKRIFLKRLNFSIKHWRMILTMVNYKIS